MLKNWSNKILTFLASELHGEFHRDRVQEIAEIIKNFDERYWHLQLFAEMVLSPHRLEDWGNRIKMLLIARKSDLERNRHEIINGNPCKYQ